jgi:hypothetical protein
MPTVFEQQEPWCWSKALAFVWLEVPDRICASADSNHALHLRDMIHVVSSDCMSECVVSMYKCSRKQAYTREMSASQGWHKRPLTYERRLHLVPTAASFRRSPSRSPPITCSTASPSTERPGRGLVGGGAPRIGGGEVLTVRRTCRGRCARGGESSRDSLTRFGVIWCPVSASGSPLERSRSNFPAAAVRLAPELVLKSCRTSCFKMSSSQASRRGMLGVLFD